MVCQQSNWNWNHLAKLLLLTKPIDFPHWKYAWICNEHNWYMVIETIIITIFIIWMIDLKMSGRWTGYLYNLYTEQAKPTKNQSLLYMNDVKWAQHELPCNPCSKNILRCLLSLKSVNCEFCFLHKQFIFHLKFGKKKMKEESFATDLTLDKAVNNLMGFKI